LFFEKKMSKKLQIMLSVLRILLLFLESFYLLYMFRYFKTRTNLTYAWTPSYGFFRHPLGQSDEPETKICPFGHAAINLLVFVMLSPIVFPQAVVLLQPSLGIALLISLVNLNATVYLIPLLITEFLLV
jgi:hypothetical protein